MPEYYTDKYGTIIERTSPHGTPPPPSVNSTTPATRTAPARRTSRIGSITSDIDSGTGCCVLFLGIIGSTVFMLVMIAIFWFWHNISAVDIVMTVYGVCLLVVVVTFLTLSIIGLINGLRQNSMEKSGCVFDLLGVVFIAAYLAWVLL